MRNFPARAGRNPHLAIGARFLYVKTRQNRATMAPNKRSLRIDLSSTIPVYQQIADQVRAMLVAGQLSPGDRLPTVRQVAVDLGVNHNTVAEAYRNLADEGWLLLERGRGAVVTERSTPAATNKARMAFAQ